MTPMALLTPIVPYPPDSGFRIRLFHFLRHLGEAFEIHLLAFGRKDEEAHLSALEAYCRDIILLPLSSKPLTRSPLVALSDFFENRAIPVYPDLRRKVKEFLDGGAFRLILVEKIHMAAYLELEALGGGSCLILDEDRVHHLNYQRVFAMSRNPWRRARALLRWKRLEWYERAIYPLFDRVLTVSELEGRLIKSLAPGARVEVVPNGVEAESFSEEGNLEEDGTLLFVGSLDYEPNVDAVRYFCQEVLPNIKTKYPGVKLRVVGREPPPPLLRLAEKERALSLEGYVEDVRPYLRSAAVVINPMRGGSGTRIKVLEALAAGKAVISTSCGAEGIEAENGRDLLLADEPSEFAKKTLELLKEPGKAKELGRAGRALVLSRYQWRRSAERLRAVMEDALNERRGGPWPRGMR